MSGVIDYETVSHCPSGASALQSCICSKNNGGNLESISSAISDSIDYRYVPEHNKEQVVSRYLGYFIYGQLDDSEANLMM